MNPWAIFALAFLSSLVSPLVIGYSFLLHSWVPILGWFASWILFAWLIDDSEKRLRVQYKIREVKRQDAV